MPTHKKGHDKDKYYHLAKDQGFRSRAAFKLIQINKRFDFLSKAKVCLDLCAAPGGWCQVAAKTMKPGSIILGIDLLPIRDIRNVKTIVSDITTSECRKIIAQELQGWKADVVLCDGAPNIGAEYKKDAYVQNELVLAALKTATDHLNEGGTFCTKIYRSQDYNSLIWVFQQLFEDVQAVKPNSSRSQSSEIFVCCMKYTAPNRIDPKLLDPNHVFKEVNDPGLQTIDVLHKKFDKHNKRHRSGYDESLGMTLTLKKTVSEFINSPDPVRVLTDANQIVFTEECSQYLSHPKTTSDITEYFKDLKVLGKIDFKKILKWRLLMKTFFSSNNTVSSEDLKNKESKTVSSNAPLSDAQIQEEIHEMRSKILQQEHKVKKKERKLAAKQRERKAIGISSESFGVDEDEELFSLNPSIKLKHLDGLVNVDLEDENVIVPRDEFEDDEMAKQQSGAVFINKSEDDLENELEEEYLRYIKRKKSKKNLEGKNESSDNEDTAYTGKKMKSQQEPSNKLKRQIELDNEFEEEENDDMVDYSNDSDSDSESDSNVTESTSESSSGETDRNKKHKKVKFSNEKDNENEKDTGFFANDEYSNLSQSNKWFSHPIFKETLMPKILKTTPRESKTQINFEDSEKTLTSDEMLAMLPKTDREIRNQKRAKAIDRKERRDNKRKAINDEIDNNDPINIDHRKRSSNENASNDSSDDEKLDLKEIKKRDLIKKGIGKSNTLSGSKILSNVEIVPQEEQNDLTHYPQPFDSRSYDSDEEYYDANDRATTLALGTLMLRQSRKKALLDSSYNRYSWNDSKDLPSWFLDDEMKHNKPQLPVPSALIDQIKGKFNLTGTKEIKKVAEARARKRKRAMNKLKAAKRQASLLADNTELSDKQKVKAISKAMRGSKSATPGKVIVVTKRTGGASSGTVGAGKGKLKFVDKRSKKDARAVKANKKRTKKKGRK